MSDDYAFLGYKGKSSMPWNSPPADDVTRPDVKEILNRHENAIPPPVEGVQAQGFDRPQAESKQDVEVEAPATPEAEEALKCEMEDPKTPPVRSEANNRLLKSIREALRTKTFGSNLEHLVPRGATGEQAIAALEKLADKLTKEGTIGIADPSHEQGFSNDVDVDAFADGEASTRGEGPKDSKARTNRTMLSPAMQKFDAGRLARQCNGGGNLNIKKGGK